MKLLTALLLSVATQSFADTDIMLVNSELLEWDKTPEGVEFAALDGNRFEASYMAMVRLPAGTISPPYVKSANMFGVMIAGSMTHTTVDSPTLGAEIGPGGFYKVPAGLPHISSCVSETPCVTFLYQDGAFDFQPVSQ